ncbi:MAG: hypothetical protein WAV10_04005, partial [Minisyncoccia bacterium]
YINLLHIYILVLYNREMRKARLFLILGIWIAILPYLGFPYSWKNILFTLSGLVLIYLSYIIYRESKTEETSKISENFSENNHTDESSRSNGLEGYYYQDRIEN